MGNNITLKSIQSDWVMNKKYEFVADFRPEKKDIVNKS